MALVDGLEDYVSQQRERERQNIRWLLEDSEYNAEQAAAFVGMGYSTLRRYLAGVGGMHGDNVSKLAYILGVDKADLYLEPEELKARERLMRPLVFSRAGQSSPRQSSHTTATSSGQPSTGRSASEQRAASAGSRRKASRKRSDQGGNYRAAHGAIWTKCVRAVRPAEAHRCKSPSWTSRRVRGQVAA